MLNLFKKKSKSVEVLAPLTGTTLSIEEVPDPVFSEKMMGGRNCHQAYYRYSCSAV